jgi:SAM-dependent methyltransferase
MGPIKDSFDDVINLYQTLEPPGVDAFNPLHDEVELWHRIRILIALARVLRQIPIPIHELKILDVGCGVGRSTRTLLELGAQPENILGIDIRPDALAYAKLINPGISFRLVRDFEEWPAPGSFNLCLHIVAFSSVRGKERRLALAAMMEKMVVPGGYIFWWDLIKANTFAGGDPIEPLKLFKNSDLVGYCEYQLRPIVMDTLIYARFWERRYFRSLMGPVLERFLRKISLSSPSHCAALFKKRQ